MVKVAAVVEVPLLRNFGSRLVLQAIPDVGDGRLLLLSVAVVTVAIVVFHVAIDPLSTSNSDERYDPSKTLNTIGQCFKHLLFNSLLLLFVYVMVRTKLEFCCVLKGFVRTIHSSQ